MTTLDYHMPSIGDVLFEMCRGEERLDDSVILAGTVTDARLRPIAGATVTVQWISYDMESASNLVGGLGDRANSRAGTEAMSGFQFTTDAAGFYRFCGVPTDMRLDVRGISGEDESDLYEVRAAPSSFAVLQPIRINRR